MLFSLIKKEIAGNVLSLRFMITLVLFFVLIQISIFTLINDYQNALHTYKASKDTHHDQLSALEEVEDLQQQVDDLIHNQGVYGDRAPQPLRIFVQGLDDDLPAQVHTSLQISRRINEAFYRNPVLALFATPDFNYIVNIVVSLLSLLFVFDAICGEKERGTLKLVLAHSVPRDLVLLGKWIGGYLSLAVPFLAALLGGITYVCLTGAIQLNGEILERLLWIVGVSLLYISLFFTLGMLISTLTHRASTALLVSLFVWICLILVIPNLSPVMAKTLSPVPSLQTTKAEKEAVDRETEFRLERFRQTVYILGPKRWEVREKIRQDGEHQKRKLDQFYEDKLQAQIELSKTLSRFSPSASFTFATTHLAGTGIDLSRRFRLGYKRFEDTFRLYGEDLEVKRYTRRLPEDWFKMDLIPNMKIPPQHLDDTIEAMLTDLLLLGIFNVLFFMLSYLFW